MEDFFKSNIKTKISIGFALAFIAFIGVQLLSSKSIENLKNSEHKMLNSSLLSQRLGTIESSIDAFENKITSFVLTGNKTFLKGNNANLREATINLQSIHELPLSNLQNNLLIQLDSLVKAEIDFSQQALIAYDLENMQNAIALVNTGKGKQLLSEITTVSNRIQQLEENNLAEIIQNSDSFSRKVVYMDYAASAFAIAVILFSMLILFRDINKRTTVEKQLRVSQQKAEQLALVKEQFMANMSHEIRTPMNAIIGFASMLSKTQLDNKQAHHLKAIQTSGENLLNIINDILDFSKIEAGMVRLEKTAFSPAELLHSLHIMFLPKANDKHIQLDFNTADNLPGIILGDPSRLTQILVNLISNALKFTNEGSIAIKVEVVNQQNENITIQFSVKDTGIGIPKEKINEIFERFTQANADTNRKYGGSGLGLSIVKKLVELQGGNISVESAENVGSSFTFIIPYQKANASNVNHRDVDSPSPQALLTKIKILVAEDNLLNQQLADSLLTGWGFDFDIVENGKLAIEKLKTNNYDLILMDIQMPEMNGYDASLYIREKLNLSIPIIAMTAHTMPGEKEKCISNGMTDYISKPIRENELYNMIAKYCNSILVKNKQESKIFASKNINNNVINLTYLNELSNGQSDFIDKIIALFLSEIPVEIQHLESSIQQRDFKSIYACAHKLKSTISFAGLDDAIKNDLEQIEELATKNENVEKIEMHFYKVKEICFKALDELRTFKSNHA